LGVQFLDPHCIFVFQGEFLRQTRSFQQVSSLSYDAFLSTILELNQISGHFLDSNGKQVTREDESNKILFTCNKDNADNRYPPIPIQYELAKTTVKASCQYQVAPKSNALVLLKIADSAQFIGKEILLTPLNDNNS
jgi:hypothetical protein